MDRAFELWEQVYNGTKKEKKKMKAALNIAVYYEMKDSLAKAEEWAVKAQQLAQKVDKKNIPKMRRTPPLTMYRITTLQPFMQMN